MSNTALEQADTKLSKVHGLSYVWALHQAGWQFHELETKKGRNRADVSGVMGDPSKSDFSAKVNRVRAALRGRGLQYDLPEACFSNSGDQILMSANPTGSGKTLKVHIPWQGYLDVEKLEELNNRTKLHLNEDPSPMRD